MAWRWRQLLTLPLWLRTVSLVLAPVHVAPLARLHLWTSRGQIGGRGESHITEVSPSLHLGKEQGAWGGPSLGKSFNFYKT